MKVYYARVSTEEQNESRQLIEAEKAGAEKIYTEKRSGKDTNRPALKAMLDFVREGDTVIVSDISRLARNTKDLLAIMEELKIKGVSFISMKESIDTNTPAGRFMLSVFGALYELERDNIKARQREGIELAKTAGKYKGRQPININEDLWREVYTAWKAGDITAVEAQRRLGLKARTFYNKVKAYENRKTMY